MASSSALLQGLFDVEGKVALVTGGSRGLGYGMARALGHAGATVVITARKDGELQEAVESLRSEGIDVRGIAADVGKAEGAVGLVEDVLSGCDRIDVLINNAGATWGAPAEEYTQQAWQKVVDVNLTGTWALTQAVAVRSMIPQRSGSIVIVASTAGLFGNRPNDMHTVAYNTTKAGQINLARTLAGEWGKYGIRVNALLPGWFPTRMTKGTLEHAGDSYVQRVPIGRLGEESDVYGPILFLASSASRYVTGHLTVVDGGMSAVF
jgi:NAD(P)-dependent dehydrogenase (short-subunit alcohol dehydrogenase family)